MEPNYVILLNFSIGELIKIKLAHDELMSAEEFDSFEEFLETIEDKYDFCTKDCLYITCQNYSERSYNF